MMHCMHGLYCYQCAQFSSLHDHLFPSRRNNSTLHDNDYYDDYNTYTTVEICRTYDIIPIKCYYYITNYSRFSRSTAVRTNTQSKQVWGCYIIVINGLDIIMIITH